jgi:V8-like Glu-specific endopeptidase
MGRASFTVGLVMLLAVPPLLRAEPLPGSPPGQVIGADSQIPVLTAPAPWSTVRRNPVARVRNNQCGTCFLVSPRCCATADHVIAGEMCANTKVQFDYEDPLPAARNGTCGGADDPAAECKPPDPWDCQAFHHISPPGMADVGIIELKQKNGKDAGAVYGTVNLNGPPAVNDSVHVIGHPDGRCKEYSHDAAAVVNNVNLVCGGRTGTNGAGANVFRHGADTEAGSSGSPIFKDNGKVLGVHHSRDDFAGIANCGTDIRVVLANLPAACQCANNADCDDGNPCTNDTCSSLSGAFLDSSMPAFVCDHAAVGDGTPCNDGDPCSTDDECESGACVGSPVSFLVRLKGRVGNGGVVDGGIGENDAGGVFQLGKDVVVTDGHVTAGDTLRIGADSTVWSVLVNTLNLGSGAVVGDGSAPFVPPLTAPFCPIPNLTCGGADVVVPSGGALAIGPGSYNRVRVLSGGTLTLAPGTYDFCSFRTARNATIEVTGVAQSTINVNGIFLLSNGSSFRPVPLTPAPVINVSSAKVRLGQAAVLEAFLSAPNALLSIGRQGVFHGTFCANSLRSDKGIMLDCVTTTTTTTTTSTTTTTAPPTMCCDVPPGALGNPVPVCLDAVQPDVSLKCSLLGGILVPGVCDPDLEQCVPPSPVPPNDFCCECPVPAPPFPHPDVCFEGVTGHEFKCQPPCVLHPATACGPVSERCGGSPSGAFLDATPVL